MKLLEQLTTLLFNIWKNTDEKVTHKKPYGRKGSEQQIEITKNSMKMQITNIHERAQNRELTNSLIYSAHAKHWTPEQLIS